MDRARVKNDVKLQNGSIISAGTEMSGLEANSLYHLTKTERLYKCLGCGTDVQCINEKKNVIELKTNQRMPYFRETNSSPHHPGCKQTKKSKLNDKKNPKTNIHNTTPYYSKLIVPPTPTLQSLSEKITGEEIDKDKLRINDRFDSYTTYHLKNISDEFIKRKSKFTFGSGKVDYSLLNEELTSLKLSLPYQRRISNFYKGFRNINGKHLYNRYKVFHGFIRYYVRCLDGYLLGFSPPKTKNRINWVPTLIKIKNELVEDRVENKLLELLQNTSYIRLNPQCFIFGQIKDQGIYSVIDLEFSNWIVFSSTDSGRLSELSGGMREVKCDDYISKIGKHIYNKYHHSSDVKIFTSSYIDDSEKPVGKISTDTPTLNLPCSEKEIVQDDEIKNLNNSLDDKSIKTNVEEKIIGNNLDTCQFELISNNELNPFIDKLVVTSNSTKSKSSVSETKSLLKGKPSIVKKMVSWLAVKFRKNKCF